MIKMYNPDTDLIFPPRVISTLSNERSSVWKDLVAYIQKADPDSPEKVAFVLMMARLNNCASCNADSFRAIQGCSSCTRQALKRFHGTDEELARLFDEARSEVVLYLNGKIISR
jgi:predicted peroxiredoxin